MPVYSEAQSPEPNRRRRRRVSARRLRSISAAETTIVPLKSRLITLTLRRRRTARERAERPSAR